MDENAEFENMEDALREIHALRRSLQRLERDNRILARLGENSEKMLQAFDTEKKLQDLYNELLLSHTPNMIFLFNEAMEYVIGSGASGRLTRRNHLEMANRPMAQLFSEQVNPEWVEKIVILNREVLEQLQPVRFHDTIELADDSPINAHITISPMVDRGGACRGTIMAINDVSELFQARLHAEEAAKSKSSFLANMSHEIRTPMNAIKGLSELLQLTELNQTQQNYVKNIVGSANSLIGVINDVLDFSKIDANKIEYVISSYSVHKLISEICGVIGLRAEEKGLDLFLEISPDIPSRLIGDDARIKQILLNLLSNAVKYTNTGRVTFRMLTRPRNDERVDLVCEVEDTGIGIREEDAPFLFDAFSRVDLRANRAIQGTGLGLAISKRLAEAMGGEIELTSEYGRGSVFTFSVPHDVPTRSVPLASVENASEQRVLLVGSGPRMKNAWHMLKNLGAAAAYFDDSGTDIGVMRKLARVDVELPPCGNPPGPYTHCIYADIVPERDIATLRARLRECRFACLRSIINSMEEPGRRDTILFNPLLVTDLSKFINRSGGRTTGRVSSDTTLTARLQVRGATALVVDDNRINLMVCEKMLNLYGLVVKTASGGEEALELCKENKFDILFVDHMMPGMDGVEVTAEIRGHEGPNRETPIIALTANVVNDMRSYYIKCGMDDFVGKPIDRNELTRVLTRWLPPGKVVTGVSKSIG